MQIPGNVRVGQARSQAGPGAPFFLTLNPAPKMFVCPSHLGNISIGWFIKGEGPMDSTPTPLDLFEVLSHNFRQFVRMKFCPLRN